MTLAIDRLQVTYPGPPPVRALDDISLSLQPGECLGILGESGSGKSTLAYSLVGLLPQARIEGAVHLDGRDLTGLDETSWRRLRWRRIALAFQSLSALNPVLRVGLQLSEPARVHLDVSESAARERAVDVLEQVGLGAWVMSRYPRELSGGQRRLVLIAMALICDPDVLVLDEPTSGLDAVLSARVLDLVSTAVVERGRTVLVMSHDPAALARLATRVAVLYRGWVAEIGPAQAVLEDARHPYSWALLNAHPGLGSIKDIRGIRGEPPDPTVVAVGCPFRERCTQAIAECETLRPPAVVPSGESDGRTVACVRAGLVPVISVQGLHKTFSGDAVVDEVSLKVREGEVVGLVGPTGAGKSTLAQLMLRLLAADGGSIRFEGTDLLHADGQAIKAIRRRAQMLFQDPFEAISPRMTVLEAVREPLEAQGIGDRTGREERVAHALRDVRLPSDNAFLGRYGHELSGGQLQRVALARALVLEPHLLVADEPLAMLDPSEQARMLQLLKSLQVERGMAMLFISHDLAVVLRVADRVLVLDRGRVVEEGTGTALLTSPRHPVTRELLRAAGRDVELGRPDGTRPPSTWPDSEPRWDGAGSTHNVHRRVIR